jgi:hypothetical protein
VYWLPPRVRLRIVFGGCMGSQQTQREKECCASRRAHRHAPPRAVRSRCKFGLSDRAPVAQDGNLPFPRPPHARPSDPLRSAKPTDPTRTLSHGQGARSTKPTRARARQPRGQRTVQTFTRNGRLYCDTLATYIQWPGLRACPGRRLYTARIARIVSFAHGRPAGRPTPHHNASRSTARGDSTRPGPAG